MDDGVPAHFQGNAQVLLAFVTTGEAEIYRLSGFVVLEIHKHVAASDIDGICEIFIERLPEFVGLVIHKPLPIFLNVFWFGVLEGCQKVPIEQPVLGEVCIIIIVLLEPTQSCWEVGLRVEDLANAIGVRQVAFEGCYDDLLARAKYLEVRIHAGGEGQ